MPWLAAAAAALGGTAGGTAAGAGTAAATAASTAAAAGAGAGAGATAAGLAGATGATGATLAAPIAAGAGGAGAGTAAGLGSALGASGAAAAPAAATGSGGFLSSLGSALGLGQSGEAGVLASLGQSVPEGVALVGPETAATGAELGAMFPQVQAVGSSAAPASFATPQLPASGGGWQQMLSQVLGSQGGGKGGDPGQSGAGGSQFNIMDKLNPESVMKSMDFLSRLGKGNAQPPPQLSLPPPNVPQFQARNHTPDWLRAFSIQG